MDHAQNRALVKTLKHQLRRRSLSYQDAADQLEVSLSTIKRIFAGEDCNIGRLMDLCSLVGLRFFDLVELARTENAPEHFFTLEQEEYFVADPPALAVFRLLHRGWQLAAITDKIGLPRKHLRGIVKDLEAWNLVERGTGDQVKAKTVGNLRWRQNGPLAKGLLRRHNHQFLDAAYAAIAADTTCYMMGESFFTRDSLKEMIAEYQTLGRKYRSRSWREEMLHSYDELVSVRSLVVTAPYETDWVAEAGSAT